jgi:nucleotide-binding universal stress UspA family protein
MFRYILVPAGGADSDDAVFHTALAMARPDNGHLAFLHVRIDMQQAALSIAGADLGGPGYGDVIDSVQREVETRQDRAHAAVAAFCARMHLPLEEQPRATAPSASWKVEAGEELQCLPAHGRTADLTVLGRSPEGETVALPLLETVLLESGRPLLIAPDHAPATLGRRIAIAWKDSAEAARAVAAAVPLLKRAESVSVVAVQERSDSHRDGQSGRRLRDALRWHNPATVLRLIAPSRHDPVDALLATVADEGADLLVMGGYSHSRLREAMFGGFTRSVLRAAHLAVLMAH